jgi:hypothetical protein
MIFCQNGIINLNIIDKPVICYLFRITKEDEIDRLVTEYENGKGIE